MCAIINRKGITKNTKKKQYIICLFQGADKGGKTPDGSKYIDVVEKEEIRKLLL